MIGVILGLMAALTLTYALSPYLPDSAQNFGTYQEAGIDARILDNYKLQFWSDTIGGTSSPGNPSGIASSPEYNHLIRLLEEGENKGENGFAYISDQHHLGWGTLEQAINECPHERSFLEARIYRIDRKGNAITRYTLRGEELIIEDLGDDSKFNYEAAIEEDKKNYNSSI